MPDSAADPDPPFDLLVIGDANPDVIVHDAPEQLTYGQAERIVSLSRLTLGGSGSLMATAAARLGLRTAFAGLVGHDAAGDLVVSALASAGVDVSGVRRVEGYDTALTVVLTRPDGDRAILTSTGTLPVLGAEHVDPGLLTSARHVHVTSLFLQARLARDLPALLARARDAGATTSLDTNDDPAGHWDWDPASLLPELDYLMPNEREVLLLTGRSSTGPAAVEAAARELAGRGPTVVVTRGAGGALAVEGDRVLRASAPSVSEAFVDAVGAGDAFDAGLVAGLTRGLGLYGALRLAVAAGSLSTRGVGGLSGQAGAAEAERVAARVHVEVEE